MFDIIREFMNTFFEMLPEISLFAIIFSIIGSMVFGRRWYYVWNFILGYIN